MRVVSAATLPLDEADLRASGLLSCVVEHDGPVIAAAVERISKIIGGPQAFDLQGECAKIRR